MKILFQNVFGMFKMFFFIWETFHSNILKSYTNATFDLVLSIDLSRLIASKINVFVYMIYVCVCCVYLLCINTHTYSIYFENIYMYLHEYIYIHVIYIII